MGLDPRLRLCRGSAITHLVGSNKIEAKSSFSLFLFQAGLSFNGSNFRPYDSIARSFLECINQGFIPPGLLSEEAIASKLVFYDGNIIIEVHDFRNCTSTNPSPKRQFLLLKPGGESVSLEVNAL